MLYVNYTSIKPEGKKRKGKKEKKRRKERKDSPLGSTPYPWNQNPRGWAQVSAFFKISLDDSEVQ